MNGHPSSRTLASYQQGTIEPRAGLVVEAHLSGCDACRRLLTLPPSTIDDSWNRVRTAIRLPTPRPAERLLTRAGLPPAAARLLIDTPLLRGGWLVGVAAMLAFAGWAGSYAGAGRQLIPFLLVAPLVPLLGVVVGLPRPSDPIAQIVAVTPTDSLDLVLMRTLATGFVGFCLAAVVDLVAIPPDRSWLWVLPSISVAALTLGLGTIVGRQRAVVLIGGLWALVVMVVGLVDQPLPAIRAATAAWAVAGVVGVIVLVVRRSHERRPRS